jgi:hypothetical protein
MRHSTPQANRLSEYIQAVLILLLFAKAFVLRHSANVRIKLVFIVI